MPFLIFTRGEHSGKRFALQDFPVTLGRDATNDLVLDDNQCSRFHFRLKSRGRIYVIEDLDSKNGTYLNGDRIINAVIHNGDCVIAGNTEIIFSHENREIEFVDRLKNFNMEVAEEISADLYYDNKDDTARSTEEFALKTPKRYDLNKILNTSYIDNADRVKIFGIESDFLIATNLEDTVMVLLKSLGKISDSLSRAVFFLVMEDQHRLMPLASWEKDTKNQSSFFLSKNALKQVIARQQALVVQLDENKTKVKAISGKSCFIVPITYQEKKIGVVHIESDSLNPDVFSEGLIRAIGALVQRATPALSSMLLQRELDHWMVGVVETMIATVEAKDTYTRGHSERVSKFSLAIGEQLKLDFDTTRILMISSICHDIGKIAIPDAILKKASILSAEEYAEMKLHPTLGAEMLASMPNAKRFLSGIKYHHERWDGTGYPEGLAGEEIPFFGRIVAVADVFDAMISGRSYSGFIDQSHAVEKISKDVDLFDPEIIKAFVKAYEAGSMTLKTDTVNKKTPKKIIQQ